MKIKIGVFLAFYMSTLLGFASKITKYYLNESITNSNFCLVISPEDSVKVRGLLVLLPGFGESVEDVLVQTYLPLQAAENGLLTIIPVLRDGPLSFGFEKKNLEVLDSLINNIRGKLSIDNYPYVMGGFSMGGTTALKNTEEAEIKPSAVFVIDSPLDLSRFYNATKREIEIFKKDRNDETYRILLSNMERIMDGSPKEDKKSYFAISPYSMEDSSQSAIKNLIGLPIRIYIEPDPEWWLENRQTDVYGLNLIDATGIINELRSMGNENAELILTYKKGYRQPDNSPHPHSWSIVDPEELIDWILSHF